MVPTVSSPGAISDRWSEMMRSIASRPVPFVAAAEPVKDSLSQGNAANAATTARVAKLVDGAQSAAPPAKSERGAPAPTGDVSVVAAAPAGSPITKGLGQVRREIAAALLEMPAPAASLQAAPSSYVKPESVGPNGRAVDMKA